MLHDGDVIILFLLIILLLYLVFRRWRRKKTVHPLVLESGRRIRGEVPDLLREEGYEVVASKQRLPLQVHVGDQSYDSRLYVDFIAKQNHEYFLVVVAKAKKPLRLSGAAVRDQFLAHVLAFQAAGVLYVNTDRGSFRKITFDITGVRRPLRRYYLSHLITLGVGALIAILIQ
ncbi:hypothetical protein [Paludifilum halophilum]|uniref:Uncharacterized protein n=1 Tax=Paludifilum halophilum TaxID=1642702 RepID=A0A235BC83_9BACL|nr:hypothetical protein [Paludifilum halophilum]OYD09822.1 hypothetical protein CHM34_02195 [Paludifilum halophilum]